MDCDNKECTYYDKESIQRCDMDFVANIDNCAAYIPCDNKLSDTDLLDFLEYHNGKARYTGKCLFRLSSTGRGWRLHETSGEGAYRSVREAIEAAIEGKSHKNIGRLNDLL